MNASQHAERALLGALLTDPTRIPDVLPWLDADDFGTQRHRTLWTLLVAAHEAKQDQSPVAILARAQDDPDARLGIDGPYLATLMQASPTPRHAAAYGRLVVEGGIHRAYYAFARRLEAFALAAGPTDVVAQRITDHLDDAAALHAEVRARWPATPDAGARPTEPAEDAPSVDPAEARLVASLLTDPAQLHLVEEWLAPHDLVHPGLRGAYAAMLALRAAGEPVDPITVMWRASADLTLDGHRFGTDQLLRLADDGVPGFAAVAARDVLVASLRHTAHHAGRTLAGTAMRPDLGPADLTAAAERVLQPAAEVGARWRTSLDHPSLPA